MAASKLPPRHPTNGQFVKAQAGRNQGTVKSTARSTSSTKAKATSKPKGKKA